MEHQPTWASLLITSKHCVLHWQEVLGFPARDQHVSVLTVAQTCCDKPGSWPDLVRTADYNQSCFFGCCNSSLRYHCFLLFFTNSFIKLATLPTSVSATQASLTQLITTLKATQSILLLPGLLPHLSYRDEEHQVMDSHRQLQVFARSTSRHLNMPQKQDKMAGPYLTLELRDISMHNINPISYNIFAIPLEVILGNHKEDV